MLNTQTKKEENKMYKYETHLHTYPVSKCASASVRESLEYYKSLDYDGVFVTNHFIDGYINVSSDLSFKERLDFYFSDYEEALELGKELDLKVFLGIETSYMGVDFLIYGLDKSWYYEHPEIMDMKKKDQLTYFMDQGALVIHAHPFRLDAHNDYIRLMPNRVHGVEIINTSRSDDVNKMAELYAKHYGLIEFAGSDNHAASKLRRLAGMCSERKILDEIDFVNAVKSGEMKIFCDNH